LFELCDPEPLTEIDGVKISSYLDREKKRQIEEIVKEFSAEFVEDLLKCELKNGAPTFKIKLKEDYKPVRAGKLRRRSKEETALIKEFVSKMTEAGMLEECGYTPNAANLVLVRKNGKTRVCVDFRALNEGTVEDLFPQERADEVLSSFEGCKYFTTLDATSGYWQVPIEETTQSLVAFKCSFGTFKWTRLPFGLVNAPSHYNRWMTEVLHGLGVKRYVDDIIIASATWEEHVEKLRQVLSRCREHGVKLKPSKSHIGMKEVMVLGHIVSEQGVRPDPEKTRAMVEMQAPSKVAELRTFLGMTSFYRKFCHNFASKTESMRKLLKKGEKWCWERKHQAEFDMIKQSLGGRDICLQHPNMAEPFYIFVDASKTGIGAVLMQRDHTVHSTGQSEEDESALDTLQQGLPLEDLHGKFRVVEYWSRSLTDAEVNYGITDLEGLGVVNAVEHWHHYIYGGKLTVFTDHKPLLAMARSSKARQIRWRLRLAPYRFEMRWMRGADHGAADGLSRNPKFATALAVSILMTRMEEEPAAEDMEVASVHCQEGGRENKLYVDQEYLKKLCKKKRPPELFMVGDQRDQPTVEEVDNTEVKSDGADQTLSDEEDEHNWSTRRKELQDELFKVKIMEYVEGRTKPWQEAQRVDKDVAKVIKQVQKGAKPGQFQIREGLLLKNGRVVVPKTMQRIVMHCAHNGIANGHPNANRTYQEIRRRFFWARMKEDIQRWVEGCLCAKGKVRATREHSEKVFNL
jgi:hypothetical protein